MIDQRATATPALELRGVTKRYGDVIAVDSVDLSVAAGSVHALLGENGAGKTTLMRIAYGLIPRDSGSLRIFGVPMTHHSVREAMRARVGMVHQHLSLVPGLTAAENLALGGRGIFRPRSAAAALEEVAGNAGLRVSAGARAGELSVVEQQRLEILKALARDARLLILDEPTALLAPSEADELLRWIRAFAAGGGSVVIVTHKLREAVAVADDVTVLRRGRVTHSGRAVADSEEALARAIFPEEAAGPGATTVVPELTGDVVVRAEGLRVNDVRGAPRLHDASFVMHRREIVGIAAVEASGHRELLLALARLRSAAAGVLELPQRIATIPADRSRDALVGEFTLTENVALHQLGRRRGLMPWRELAERTRALLARFNILAPSERLRARALSGGNQQRLVVARELERPMDLVVADNPTRGLDMRATMFVHDQLRAAAREGAAVVVHSSDVDELLSLATRVLVVFHGQLREVPRTRDAIGRAMLGAA